jgi:3-mercaptopyruvate sulfurtransferase SseA
VSLAEFKKLHAARTILSIDVRDPHAYENGHIPGALNVSFVDVEIMANRLLKEPRPIVAYCACKDEMTAARVAIQLMRVGVKNIRVLTGGWDGWTAGGGKVEFTPPPAR